MASGSKASTSTTSQSTTNVQELNLQDTGGFTAADNKNSTITYVSNALDGGAIAGAGDVANNSLSSMLAAIKAALTANNNVSSDAIGANTNITNSAINAGVDLGKGAYSLSQDVSQSAIDLGGSAISTGAQLANAGLDNAQAAYQSGLTFGNNALGVVEQLAEEFSTQNASLTANALDGYQTIAQQNSASTSTQIQKIAIYAIVAAVLLVVLPKVFK